MPLSDTDVWAAFISGGRRDLTPLLRHYREFVVRKKAEYVRRHPALPPDDVENEVEFGFYQAARNYDPSRGAKFETYSTPRIHGAVQDQCRSVDPLTRRERANGVTAESVSIDAEGVSVAASLRGLPARDELSYSIEDAELWHRVFTALRAGRGRYGHRVVALTVFRLGWRYCEVAKYLGCSPSNVAVLMGQVRRTLAKSVGLRMYLEGRSRRRSAASPPRQRYSGTGRFALRNAGHACCRIGCPNKAQRRGMCGRHYHEAKNRDTPCTAPGCDRLQWEGGLCARHLRFMAAYGTLTPELRSRLPGSRKGKLCESCGADPQRYKGLCGSCYVRKRYYDARGLPVPPRKARGLTCACGSPAGWKGQCPGCRHREYDAAWRLTPAGAAATEKRKEYFRARPRV